MNPVDNKNNQVIIIYPQTSGSSNNSLPLGPLYLAESLQKAGYSVSIVDGAVDSILQSIQQMVPLKTVVFGISSMSGTQLMHSITIAKELKKRFPAIPIVFGGAHATALPRQTLEPDYIDYVIYGEGEISFPLLLNSILLKTDPSTIKGIGYKVNGEVKITERSDYTPLNKIFSLPYNLIDMKKYTRELLIGPHKDYLIYTSRGCPFNCYFCSNSSNIWPNNKMRYHTIEHVLKDVSTLINNYGADGITIGDENFFVNETRVIELCNAFIQEGFNKKVKFRGGGRADMMAKLSPGTWELLKETGFIGIGVGIESGSQHALDLMGKGITLKQIYRTDEMLTKYRLYKTYNFMTCIPGETISDVKETLNLIITLAKTSEYTPYPFGTLHKYVPLPGTRLFDVAVHEHGFVPPHTIEGWTGFEDTSFSQNIPQVRPWLSGELLSYVDRANQLIETLNNLFIGENCDKQKIESQIEKIKTFILT